MVRVTPCESRRMIASEAREMASMVCSEKENSRGTMEIDFLIVRGYDNAAMKPRISPVEVKSTKRYGTSSLDKFRASFGKRLGTEYVLHPRQLQVEGDRVYLPLYASFCL